MKIAGINLSRFMLFDSLDITWSPNINVISGNNNTGKTALMKVMYATLKAFSSAYNGKIEPTKDTFDNKLVSKLQGVFRPDDNNVGRLVRRVQGSNSTIIKETFGDLGTAEFSFSNRSKTHVEFASLPQKDISKMECVYIPPKEIISATENFAALYDEYHIAFEETYYDLTRLLERPLKKGPNTNEQNTVLKSFEDIVNGRVVMADKKFFLSFGGKGNFEMGLVSEGYRKISTIMYLIQNRSLGKNSVLFWDEPETNMNPKMIEPMCQAMVELAKMGVQVFVTTHDYFVQQSFNLLASYPTTNAKKLNIQFTSLFETDGNIHHETGKTLNDLSHNLVMDEFDALYDREQGLIDEN